MNQDRVLVIDDDKITRQKLQKIIQKEGFDSFSAASGKEGLELFRREKPDVIITDLKMPEIDGLEVLRSVKKILPETEVILITAFGDYDTAILALREGAFDYLRKPIDLDQVLLALGRYQQKKSERQGVSLEPTVLLLDDDENTRDKVRKILTKEGLKALVGADGEEGLRLFEENKIDVVLADVKMPKKDGLEFLAEAKKLRKDVEVIMLTGYGDENIAAQAMRQGAVNFLKKPVDIDYMILSIKKAFERVSLNRNILYLRRELELAHQFIARITQDREIVFDVRDHTRKPARDFARTLIDSLPLPLMVVDKEMNLLFSNRQLREIVESEPSKVDQKLLNKLMDLGIKKLGLDEFKGLLSKVLKSKEAKIETISSGKYAFVNATKMTVITDQGIKNNVLIVIRGERKQNGL